VRKFGELLKIITALKGARVLLEQSHQYGFVNWNNMDQ